MTYSFFNGSTISYATLAGPFTLGISFKSLVPGFVNGFYFYKDSSDTGSHVGRLWSSTGSQLANVTFTGETASGWQYKAIASPYQISPNVVYIASIDHPANFSYSSGYFVSNTVAIGPLVISPSPNGLYAAGVGNFPNSVTGNDNYLTDILFSSFNRRRRR